MKFTKMSLVAALLVGSSAFAIENTKVSGDAKLFYGTNNVGANDMFNKDSSAADAALNLNITTDLAKNDLVSVSAGLGYTVLTTLGLENNLVSNVWGGAHTAVVGTGASYGGGLVGGAKAENANWMNEAWVAVSLNQMSKTTLKLGRMKLDTPLAFTETWSIEENSFEAAVVINQDLPDTTIVAAYVGNGNGTETFGQNLHSNINPLTVGGKNYNIATAPVVNGEGTFATYGQDGAYAIAVINNSYKPLVAQAWYYEVTNTANAYWLQADLDATDLGVKGLTAGAQYSGITVYNSVNVNGALPLAGAADVDSDVYALMVGYSMKDMFSAKLAYSQVGKDHSAGFNTATAAGTAQSKLYTEAWWNYGYVTRADTSAINLTVEGQAAGIDLGAYFTQTSTGGNTPQDLTEIALTASKSFGPLDTTAAFIQTDAEDQNIAVGATTGSSYSTLQVYLTLNF